MKRTAPVLQSLAAVAAVTGLLLAVGQYMRGEASARERQRRLAEIGAEQCSRVADELQWLAQNLERPNAWAEAASLAAPSRRLLGEIPLVEMPSGSAVFLLSECRREADALTEATRRYSTRFEICDRSAMLRTQAGLLLAESVRQHGEIKTGEVSRDAWRVCDSFAPPEGFPEDREKNSLPHQMSPDL